MAITEIDTKNLMWYTQAGYRWLLQFSVKTESMGENALKKRAFSTALALCLCLSATPFAYARQEPVLPQRDAAGILTRNPAPHADVKVPTQQEAYEAMIALKDKERYQEGAPWTNETHEYRWNGGTQGGIAAIGAGCVAFAYELSDAAFGSLPARATKNFTHGNRHPGERCGRRDCGGQLQRKWKRR